MNSPRPLKEIIGEAIGEASVLFTNTERMFESEKAEKLMLRVIDEIQANIGMGWTRYTTIMTDRAELLKALEFYANGGKPTKEWPYKEFGCGCCSSSVTFDEDGDFEADYNDTDIQGKRAKEAIAASKARVGE